MYQFLYGRVYYGRIANKEEQNLWIDYEKQVTVTILALKMIDNFCYERGIKHVVVIVPHGFLVEIGLNYTARKDYNEEFKADVITGLDSKDIAYVDLTPFLKAESPKAGDLFFNHLNGASGHLNVKGNKVVAEILVAQVNKICEKDIEIH